jgi:NAD kinase
MPRFDKLVIVTQKTALEELVERFNTVEQARFYIEHMGGDFAEYTNAHQTYLTAMEYVKGGIPKGLRHQMIDRSFLPTFLFGDNDMVACLGRDGLVVNTAKYLQDQPLIGLNPDSQRIDGILLPFYASSASFILPRITSGQFKTKSITMAQATLNDGQTQFAVNDLFIGPKSHTSARYTLEFAGKTESQSSSGIIVSTGAGSTGWFRSILVGSLGVVGAFAPKKDLSAVAEAYRFDSDARMLYFSVREPFISKTSSCEMIFGKITEDEVLKITSQMPKGGVIFSDGIESDFLEFNSGAVATIMVAKKKIHLVIE